VFALLIGSAITAYRSMNDSVSAARWVLHTHEMLEVLQATLLVLKDVEAGSRGYVITGDRSYLKPYDLALAAVDVHLMRLTANDGDQPQRLAKAEALIS
jgi:CHASE3 domain sensor protein